MIARILRAPLTRLLLIAVVPALVLGVFVGALAAADSGTARVPAALVNRDELVTTTADDGTKTTIAAGRLVTSGLTKPADSGSGLQVDWTLTNAAQAESLLQSGQVYAIVTIPKDFSKSISTLSSSDPEQADIAIRTDDAHGTLVSQIGGLLGDTIARTIGTQISANVVQGLYGGYATVRTSLLDASDGAKQLGDGADSLSSGLAKAADGGEGLASGARSLGNGAAKLADGARSLGSGLDRAASGAGSAASGAKKLASGVDSYTDGVAQYTKGVDSFLTGVAPAFDGTSAAAQGKLATGSDQIAAALGRLAQDPTLSAQQAGTLKTLSGQLGTIADGQQQLADGAAKLSGAGAAIPRLKSGGASLRSGGSSLDSGSASLAKGLGALPAGLRRSASGARSLGTGADGIASGAGSLASGAAQLTSGVRRSASGAGDIADGATKLGDGLADGAEQVPNLTKAQQERAGKVVSDPIGASDSRLNTLSGPGEIVSTLITPVGLWIGAAAAVLLFGAVRRRLLDTGVGTPRLVGEQLVRGSAVAVVQAVLVAVLLKAAVGVAWPLVLPAFLVALVAGVAFLAIQQLLQAVFGRAGTVLSIVLLGVQLVAVGGIYPIELVSAPFQVISPFLPLTAAVTATQAVLTGAGAAPVLGGIGALLLWTLIAFLGTIAVVARRRASVDRFAAVPVPA